MATDIKRLLLVEDNESMIDVFVDEFAPLGVDLLVARSKAEAQGHIIDGEFGVAVCDLGIPTNTGWLDADAEHGASVIAKMLKDHPDVPLVVFAGSSSIHEVQSRFANDGLTFFNKSELPECLREVSKMLGVQ